jgi:hypothetical protein
MLIGAVCADVARPVTFNKDVLPILEKNCQSCHRPGQVAPMSFLTYEGARPWAKAMKAAVLTRKMPPWFADARFGHFANDRSLDQSAIETIAQWTWEEMMFRFFSVVVDKGADRKGLIRIERGRQSNGA